MKVSSYHQDVGMDTWISLILTIIIDNMNITRRFHRVKFQYLISDAYLSLPAKQPDRTGLLNYPGTRCTLGDRHRIMV